MIVSSCFLISQDIIITLVVHDAIGLFCYCLFAYVYIYIYDMGDFLVVPPYWVSLWLASLQVMMLHASHAGPLSMDPS